MSSYTTRTGDTFDSISRARYGNEFGAGVIASANPGVSEPIPVGTTLTIPQRAGDPVDSVKPIPTQNLDDVTLLIGGSRFVWWESITISTSIDAPAVLSLSAPFDPDNAEFRKRFKPFTFPSVVAMVGGVPIFTGTLVQVSPTVSSESRTIEVEAYSRPGVLSDCTPPVSTQPLEFEESTLRDIATTLCAPFGILARFEADTGAAFSPRVECEPDKTIWSFLTDLARQRGVLLGVDSVGSLVFRTATDDRIPAARLIEGASPVINVSATFSPQSYYSDVTAANPVNVGSDGATYTVRNPHLRGTVRPVVFKTKDVEDAQVKEAAEAKAGRMFGSIVSYTVEVSTWRDPTGALWSANTIVTLDAPSAMVYGQYTFLVQAVEFRQTNAQRTAVLTLVLREAYTDKIPEVLPWD